MRSKHFSRQGVNQTLFVSLTFYYKNMFAFNHRKWQFIMQNAFVFRRYLNVFYYFECEKFCLLCHAHFDRLLLTRTTFDFNPIFHYLPGNNKNSSIFPLLKTVFPRFKFTRLRLSDKIFDTVVIFILMIFKTLYD